MFRWRSSNWRNCWGYEFEWTPEHLTADQLRPLIFTYDILASDALDRLDKISPPPKPRISEQLPQEAGKKPRRDLYEILKDNADKDEKLQELWEQVTTVPDWVDWDQIERGQKVFYRYGGPTIVALTFQSLLGGMGGRRVVETLTRTGGFGTNVARHRLLETFQHVLQVTKSLESIQPGGDGFASSIRVRLLHASVRRRILQLAQSRPEYYNVQEFGIPINDLDSIGTVSTFSATVIWSGFRRQGIFLRTEEIVDYIALWRWVAYILGTPTEFFATPARAKMIMESLVVSEIAPTETSKTLANNILTGLSNQPPTFASREFLCAEAHWLNGRQLADGLAIERPRLYYTLLVVGQCIFFMFMSYVYRAVPAWDERKIQTLRSILYKITVHNTEQGALGQESVFDFKYIPSLDMPGTERGAPEGSGLLRGGVERRNLKALLAAAAFVGVLSWLGLRAASAVSGKILV